MRAEEAFNNRGAARQDFDDVIGAIADFSKAVQLEPSYAEAYANRGLAYLLQGKDQHAPRDFDRALNINEELKDVLEERIRKLEAQRAGKRRDRREKH